MSSVLTSEEREKRIKVIRDVLEWGLEYWGAPEKEIQEALSLIDELESKP